MNNFVALCRLYDFVLLAFRVQDRLTGAVDNLHYLIVICLKLGSSLIGVLVKELTRQTGYDNVLSPIRPLKGWLA